MIDCSHRCCCLGVGIAASVDRWADMSRDIHANPELGFVETRKAGIAGSHLVSMGFEVTTGVGGAGVVGLVRNGPGPTVLVRADMDALPVLEATESYASTQVGTDAAGMNSPDACVRARPARRVPAGGVRTARGEPGHLGPER